MSGISSNVTTMQIYSINLTWLKGALSVGVISYLSARPHKSYGMYNPMALFDVGRHISQWFHSIKPMKI